MKTLRLENKSLKDLVRDKEQVILAKDREIAVVKTEVKTKEGENLGLRTIFADVARTVSAKISGFFEAGCMHTSCIVRLGRHRTALLRMATSECFFLLHHASSTCTPRGDCTCLRHQHKQMSTRAGGAADLLNTSSDGGGDRGGGSGSGRNGSGSGLLAPDTSAAEASPGAGDTADSPASAGT